jgi:hypothetical protein
VHAPSFSEGVGRLNDVGGRRSILERNPPSETQGVGDPVQDSDPNLVLPRLEPGDDGLRRSDQVRQLLLGEIALCAQSEDGPGETGVGHDRSKVLFELLLGPKLVPSAHNSSL